MKLEYKLRSLLLAYELPMLVHASIDDAADELEALRKDAERYRWLRACSWYASPLAVVEDPKKAVKIGYLCPSMENLDVRIDASMKDNP